MRPHNPYMEAFREARKLMGFKHTSAYIPANRVTEFSLYVERLKAERMIELLELDPHGRERRALASRNLTDVPTVEEAYALAKRVEQPSVNRQVKLLVDHLNQANSAFNVAKVAKDDDDVVKWMSVAVAHNHMANIIWRELAHVVRAMEGGNEPPRPTQERPEG